MRSRFATGRPPPGSSTSNTHALRHTHMRSLLLNETALRSSSWLAETIENLTTARIAARASLGERNRGGRAIGCAADPIEQTVSEDRAASGIVEIASASRGSTRCVVCPWICESERGERTATITAVLVTSSLEQVRHPLEILNATILVKVERELDARLLVVAITRVRDEGLCGLSIRDLWFSGNQKHRSVETCVEVSGVAAPGARTDDDTSEALTP
jgi:hypothetical protein